MGPRGSGQRRQKPAQPQPEPQGVPIMPPRRVVPREFDYGYGRVVPAERPPLHSDQTRFGAVAGYLALGPDIIEPVSPEQE